MISEERSNVDVSTLSGQTMSGGETRGEGRSGLWRMVWYLGLVCLGLRVTRLLALPIFGDEAIYLRWSQLIRADPLREAFLPLVDPKPPLHFWLIAACWEMASDPLFSARMISAVSGAGTVVLLGALGMALHRELVEGVDERTGEGRGRGPSVGTWIVILLAMVIGCPYLAFYQRLASADALTILESVAVAWIGVKWAVAVLEEETFAVMGWTVGLGVVMGLAMLTRQNLSYVLWGLPVVEYGLIAWRRNSVRGWFWGMMTRGGMAGATFLFALGLAGVMWSPFLLEQPERYERGKVVEELKRRVLYQAQFSEPVPVAERVRLAQTNLVHAFLPVKAGGDGAWAIKWDEGWFWVHLTWPVYALVLAAVPWMVWRGQGKLLVLLLVWSFLMLGPLLLLGSVVRSRYAVAGAVPLVIMASYVLADGLTMVAVWMARRGSSGWEIGGVVVGLLVIVMGLGVVRVSQQVFWPYAEAMTDAEDYEYRTGWTAGLATTAAVKFLSRPELGKVAVITTNGWGPADALWVYLTRIPKLRVYYVDDHTEKPILRKVGGAVKEEGTGGGVEAYWMKSDKWLYEPERAVTLPEMPIVFVCPDPIYAGSGELDAVKVLSGLNRFDGEAITFENPAGRDGHVDRIRVFVLRGRDRLR